VLYILFNIIYLGYLHYPKCFQQCLNPEKSAILNSVMARVIAAPIHDIIFLESMETPQML